MSTALEVTGDVLAAAGLGLRLGDNLRLGSMPDLPQECVSVQEYDGLPPQETMGLSSPVIDCPRVQIMVRGDTDDYAGPRDLALACRNALAVLGPTTLRGLTVMRWAPQGSVLPLGPDGTQRLLFTVNLQVWTR